MGQVGRKESTRVGYGSRGEEQPKLYENALRKIVILNTNFLKINIVAWLFVYGNFQNSVGADQSEAELYIK